MICITEEPATLACFDANTGERTWATTNRYQDTLPVDERDDLTKTLQALDEDHVRLQGLRSDLGRLQRDLRRSTAGDQVRQEYEGKLAEADLIRSRLKEYEKYRTPNNKGIIGYGTPTPMVSSGHIYALFGNGVLSKFSASGERSWSVWLGEPVEPMRGYDYGTAASPVMADGVLVAPFARLRGIDPSTGAILWEGPSYPHYGTPAIAHVGNTTVIISPGGEMLRAKDGAEVGPTISAIEFIGPVADGDVVYVIGWVRAQDDRTLTRGTAYKLRQEEGGKIGVTELWGRDLSAERTYASPLLADKRLYVLFWRGELQVLDAATGDLLSTTETRLDAKNGSPSPTLGGDRIVIGSERGSVNTFSHEDSPRVLGARNFESHRATPLLDGDRIYIRGFEHLYCVE